MNSVELDTVQSQSLESLESLESNGDSLSSNLADDHKIDYPDGGLEAYLVTAGAFFGAIVFLGIINSVGAIQAYVSTHQLANISAATISWIFSIYLSLAYSIGVFVGPIFDRKGARVLVSIAAILVFGGLMGAANSTEIYQFILSFICMGVGNGIGLTPVIGVVNHWFFTKRGIITGVVTSGGSVGGLMFSLLLRHTLVKYDYVWSLRILAFISFACCALAVILSKERIRQKPTPDENSVAWKDLTLHNITEKISGFVQRHNDLRFIFVIMGSFCTELCLVLALTYYVTFFVAKGIADSTAYLLLTTWNATSILGRLLPGYASDYIGKFNVNIAMIFCLDICIFAMWLPFGSNLNVMYAFSALGGFFAGAILGMLPACLAQISKVSQFGERYGVLNFFLSFGNLVGIPIAAAVIGDGSSKNYDHFVCLVGALSVAGTLFYYASRYVMVGTKLNVKV